MARRGSEPDEREQTRIIENPIQCLQNQIAHNGFRKVGRTSVTVYNHLGLWDRRGEGGRYGLFGNNHLTPSAS